MASEIQISCPYCNSVLSAHDDWLGMETKCPSCNREFVLQNSEDSPPELPHPPELPPDLPPDLPPELPPQLPAEQTIETIGLDAKESGNPLKYLCYQIFSLVGQEQWFRIIFGEDTGIVVKHKSTADALRRRQVRKYFFPPGFGERLLGGLKFSLLWGLFFILGSIMLGLISGLLSYVTRYSYLLPIFGIPLWLVFSFRLTKKIIGRKIKEEEIPDFVIDQYIAEDFEKVIPLSLRKANIDLSQCIAESQMLEEPCFDEDATGHAYKLGKDGKVRYTPIAVSVIHMLEDQIICYAGDLDLLTGVYLNETVDEFFYDDIVSIQTLTESENSGLFDKLKQKTRGEYFELTTRGGTKFRLGMDHSEWLEKQGETNVDRSYAEKIINGVRKMIREKKKEA